MRWDRQAPAAFGSSAASTASETAKYAVCWRHAGRLRFRTVGFDVAEAACALALIAATPPLRFETVAGWWLERFEAKVGAGERHPRTL